MRYLIFVSVWVGLLLLSTSSTVAAQGAQPSASYRISVLDRAGADVAVLTDGDTVSLAIDAVTATAQERTLSLALEGQAGILATCTIPAGQTRCTTPTVSALGWYWNEAGQVQPQRRIYVPPLQERSAVVLLTVHPRPVVMVHGFGADFHTWDAYLGPAGYLARLGVPGYAVGDGQVAGALNTGSPLRPGRTTNTIAQNAAILGEYIAAVKEETGAETVDLVVHSMGGLISRYYIARLMGERDVAQLIMLGTPNGGSDCALLIGGLRLFQPAALELRTDYAHNVFNAQITDQRGVPFVNFAGTPIQRRILSPCTGVPNDLVVSLESASVFTNELVEVPYLHIDLNPSEELFLEHVAPLLRQPPQAITARADRLVEDDARPSVQFSTVYTGMVTTLAGEERVIHIDRDVAVASFGIYDPSRSLTVTVRGASGNVITLDADANGLTVVDDPDALFYLGYGFENPRPGPWRVTVQPTLRTPPLGTTYAIVVQYEGGATIQAALNSHLVGINSDIVLSATLSLGDDSLPIDAASISLTHPDGSSTAIPVADFSGGLQATWQVTEPGIYGIDVHLRSELDEGIVVERSTYLAIQAFERAPSLNE